jgi:hypothetical protein
MHADGTFVGRAAPEIDIFEAQVWIVATSCMGSLLMPLIFKVTPDGGEVSQSAQFGVSADFTCF